MLSYEEIISGFSPKMLAGDHNHVVFLRNIKKRLGSPEQAFKTIHIAGTNGKGSTGMMIKGVLEHAGYKVGYFNSPALIDDREQISINNILISRNDFVATYYEILNKLSPDESAKISVFEWWTLIMLVYFANKKVDWAVIECGLGGTDDATNIINAPEYAIFTHIALDHIHILGDTVEKIAKAKSGIIKYGTKATIIAPLQQKAVVNIIKEKCSQAQVPLILSDEIAKMKVHNSKINIISTDFTLESSFSLLGEYQRENLKTVIALVKQLMREKVLISLMPLKQMLETIKIPARCEKIASLPDVLIDGAHNPDAAYNLAQTIISLRHGRRVIMILGFLKDKNYQKMIQIYQEISHDFILTEPDHLQRKLPVAILAQNFNNHVMQAVNVRSALKIARQNAKPDDLIVVTGSFYLVKDLINDD